MRKKQGDKGGLELSSTLQFVLDGVQQGCTLVWDVITECSRKVNVTLSAGDKIYFNAKKLDYDTQMQLLSQDTNKHNCCDLPVLTITVDDVFKLKSSHTTSDINDSFGNKIGCVHYFYIEDTVDRGSSDIYINIVGWKMKS